MEFWNTIINTALLGTDKMQSLPNDMPADVLEAYEQINANTSLDKEDKFLQAASVAFNYRQSGVTAARITTIEMPEAEHEEKPYCQAKALQVLRDILDVQATSLLEFWLGLCGRSNQIVTPELIPNLFEEATKQKKLRTAIAACCGKRGVWLGMYNEQWRFGKGGTDEEIWGEGTPEERKKLLQHIREQDPAKGREWLQQTWAAENANAKADLLKQLETNLGIEDAPWLETLLAEKSVKIKGLANDLLKRIPGSTIVNKYWAVVQQSVFTKKEKAFLGLSTKSVLHIELTGMDESLFETGMEKMSSTKEMSDEVFILHQLISFVPPSYWEAHFELTPDKIIALLQKDAKGAQLIPAIAAAAYYFKDLSWAKAFMQDEAFFFSYLLSLLPEAEQDAWSIKYFAKDSEKIIEQAVKRTTEWSKEFAKTVVIYAAANAWVYHRGFFQEHIQLIPVSILQEMDSWTVPDERFAGAWKNTKEHLGKLLSLKYQTIQAFKQ